MQRFLAVLKLLSALALSALAAGPVQGTEVPYNPPASMPAEFSLRVHETVQLGPEGPWVNFLGFEDKRCPPDAQCVSAGAAYAVFAVQTRGDEPYLVVAATSTRSYRRLQSMNRHPQYGIRLVSLEARLANDGKPDPGSYMARIVIDRNRR